MLILQELDMKKGTNWTFEKLNPMSPLYKTALNYGRIQILDKKLVLYKPIIVDDVFFLWS